MAQTQIEGWRGSQVDVVEGVTLPLKNLEFMIQEFLLANGSRLDVETRFLLAGVRDCLGQVAVSSTRLTRQ